MQLSKIVVWYLKASLVYLLLGTTLGLWMALGYSGLVPGIGPSFGLVLAHVHLLLVGFVTMMIIGVSYHILPRFAGRGPDPYSPFLARLQFWILNAGLLVFAVSLIGSFALTTGLGALAMVVAMFIYAYNVWRTISPPQKRA